MDESKRVRFYSIVIALKKMIKFNSTSLCQNILPLTFLLTYQDRYFYLLTGCGLQKYGTPLLCECDFALTERAVVFQRKYLYFHQRTTAYYMTSAHNRVMLMHFSTILQITWYFLFLCLLIEKGERWPITADKNWQNWFINKGVDVELHSPLIS